VIGVIMLVAIAFADPAVVADQMGDGALLPWVWALLQALRFAAGIAILLFGVRMFLAEIVPAFKGLSERALPGAKPALDLPVTFTRAPTAVMLGFVASTIVFLVVMAVFAATGLFVLVPPMIMLFFGGAAGGVFGNAVAGWRGALFGGALNGLVLGFGQWIGWSIWGDTAPELATLADPDWFVVGWLLFGLAAVLAPLGDWAMWLVPAAVLALTITTLVILGRRRPGAVPPPSSSEQAATTTSDARPMPDRAPAMAGASADGSAPASAAATTTVSGSARPDTLSVLAVCGAGMGSSLILRTTAERALRELDVPAHIEHADVGSARGQRVDLVIAQPSYLVEVGDIAPVAVPITSFVDVGHVRERLREALEQRGWL